MLDNNSNKKIARITGALLIFATVTGILSVVLLTPIVDTPNYLINISANENQVLAGILLQFIMAIACAGIAISLYPILEKYNEGLALGSVILRAIEGILYIIGAISLLVLLTLSQEFLKAWAPDNSYFQILGILLLAGRDLATNLGLMSFSLGALMYYYIFYQSKLIPRWLSGWGIIGVILLIISSILVMFRLIDPMSMTQNILAVPIALQEMVLAVWLIVKGFNSSAMVSAPVGHDNKI